MKRDQFLDYVIDTLSPLCTVEARKMFGGYGLYVDRKIFALIAAQELYLKSHREAADFFVKFGSEPFSYERKGKMITMSYWRVPPEVLENQEWLEQWLAFSFKA